VTPSVKPRFSILLLVYNQPDHLKNRMREITACLGARDDTEVLILDNGSTVAMVRVEAARIAAEHAGNPLFAMTRLVPNKGFHGGFNHLAKMAHGDILIFLSSDVAVKGDIIGPLTDYYAIPGNEQTIVAHRIVDWKAGWNQFGDTLVPYPEGYFLAIPRDVWDAFGGFDGIYHPSDFEDVDLGMWADRTGTPLIAMPQLPVVHQGAGTIGQSPDRFEHTVAMRALFASKWGLPNIPERP